PAGATTLWEIPDAEARRKLAADNIIVCPAQTGATDCCGSCGLCWHPSAKTKTIGFIAHGARGGHGQHDQHATRRQQSPPAVETPAAAEPIDDAAFERFMRDGRRR